MKTGNNMRILIGTTVEIANKLEKTVRILK